jgi:hypothetical protein
LGV